MFLYLGAKVERTINDTEARGVKVLEKTFKGDRLGVEKARGKLITDIEPIREALEKKEVFYGVPSGERILFYDAPSPPGDEAAIARSLDGLKEEILKLPAGELRASALATYGDGALLRATFNGERAACDALSPLKLTPAWPSTESLGEKTVSIASELEKAKLEALEAVADGDAVPDDEFDNILSGGMGAGASGVEKEAGSDDEGSVDDLKTPNKAKKELPPPREYRARKAKTSPSPASEEKVAPVKRVKPEVKVEPPEVVAAGERRKRGSVPGISRGGYKKARIHVNLLSPDRNGNDKGMLMLHIACACALKFQSFWGFSFKFHSCMDTPFTLFCFLAILLLWVHVYFVLFQCFASHHCICQHFTDYINQFHSEIHDWNEICALQILTSSRN